MNPVKEFYELTIQIIELMENSGEQDRDSKIEKIEGMLQKREALMVEIKPPFSSEENELGKKIIELNKKLEGLMETEKVLIQKDIKDLNIKKQSNKKYTNPYQSLSTDGMFYDRKK